MDLTPDQKAALMEQINGGASTFGSIRTGLWLTNGKPDFIKYYIDPQIGKFQGYQGFPNYLFPTCVFGGSFECL